jgi:hypothetical protein
MIGSSPQPKQSWLGSSTNWLIINLFLLTLLLAATAYTAPITNAQTSYQLDPNMQALWKRNDLLVQQQKVNRSWLWGPEAFAITAEEFEEAPAGGQITIAGKRLVAYYDKARMEVNNPFSNRISQYFISNGLLVKELINGERAIGYSKTVSSLPAQVPVAGDEVNYTDSPTYASLISIASLVPGQNRATNRIDGIVTSYLSRNSTFMEEDQRFAAYNVKIAYYENDVFGHNIPKIFWDFMNSVGRVIEDGVERDNLVLSDWRYTMGYPITEPYWATVAIRSQPRDVLTQCFERRCLTYTPSNPDGFKVEMGNVGQHYYKWRYQTPKPKI